jgi:DNA-binding winged helix-turn-helix (wHTH) protein/Tol biopolymer transport system component
MDFVNENEVGFTKKVKEVVFGHWTLSPKYHTITDGSIQRELEPLLFSLLTYFIKHNDRIVSRQELVDEVWKQAYVDDNAINRAMSELRKVLKSEKQRAQVVKTHYRKGYSFTLEIEVIYYEQKQKSVTKAEVIEETTEVTQAQVLPLKNDPKAIKPKMGIPPIYLKGIISLLFIIPIISFFYFNDFNSVKTEEPLASVEASSVLLSWQKGTSLLPLLSKDSKYVAYSFRESGTNGFNLNIKEMDSLKEFKIADNDADIFPIGWSRKRELFYQIIRNQEIVECEIWKANLAEDITNTRHEKLFNCQSGHIMSADATDDGNTLLYTKFNYREHPNLSAIVARDLKSGSEYQVSSPNLAIFGDYYVKISNNGDKVIFLRQIESGTGIFVANIDGNNQRKLIEVDYYVTSISWNALDESISWMNVINDQINTFHFDTDSISKYKVDIEYSMRSTFGFKLASSNRALLATDYFDRNISKIHLKDSELTVSDFSNTDVYESMVSPFHSKNGGIYLVREGSRSIWSLIDNNRKKLVDVDLSEVADILVSPDDKKFLIAGKNEILIYQLDSLKLLNQIPFDGSIEEVSWVLPTRLLLTYKNGSSTSLWFYDLDRGQLVQISKSVVERAIMLDEERILSTTRKGEIFILDVNSGESSALDINLPASNIVAWTADKNYFYYSIDGITIYKKSLVKKDAAEKLTKLKQGGLLELTISPLTEDPTLYLTLFDTRDNLLLDLTF